jgi:hypothetical protein
MPVQKENLAERVQRTYALLSALASDLNASSDKLGASIAALDNALRRLNLGVSSWVHFSESHSEDNFHFHFEDIGYAKIGPKWGLAIRTVTGNERDDCDDVDEWPFNESPRALRVEAVKKVPELLDQLIQDANKMINEVEAQVERVDLLAAAIDDIEAPRTVGSGKRKTNSRAECRGGKDECSGNCGPRPCPATSERHLPHRPLPRWRRYPEGWRRILWEHSKTCDDIGKDVLRFNHRKEQLRMKLETAQRTKNVTCFGFMPTTDEVPLAEALVREGFLDSDIQTGRYFVRTLWDMNRGFGP